MKLNENKTKIMIFNFTNNYKFTTRLQLKSENVEVVKSSKLLGTIITDNLTWDENTNYLVKKGHTRMQLLRKVASFTSSKEEKKNIYIQFIRSIIEQSCVVWHSSLTQENSNDIERVQKSAVKIILGKEYSDYDQALIKLNLDSLKTRREDLCTNFAVKSIHNNKTENLFPLNKKKHPMKTKKYEKFKVKFANTTRFKKSTIPHMQRLLNLKKILS